MNATKSIEKLIQQFSVEKGFYNGENEADRLIKKMARLIGRGNMVDTGELWGEEASEFAVFYQYSEEDHLEEVKEELLAHVPDENEYQMYYVIVFTDTYERKAKAGQWEKELRTCMKAKLKCGLSMIQYQALTYCGNTEKEFIISIGDRLNQIVMPESKFGDTEEGAIARKVEAHTYTASLYDIVKMYNEVGDELFRQNVRYGIKDQLDVETSIKKTLREHPGDFWFLNNGITIIVQDHTALNLSKNTSIGLNYKKSQIISVINGAQTISTAAEFWFADTGNTDSQKDDVQLRERARKSAKVLLRVMCVSDSEDDCQKELDEISISLNRQKPIKSEDIAYTSPVILEINQLYKPEAADNIHFRITKRGEELLGKYKYNLTDFARIVKAYKVQKPGEARTQSANKIVKYNPEASDSVYANEILVKDAEMIFDKVYRPTNFAMCLLSYYKEFGKRETKSTEKHVSAILGNGRYYFVSYMIRTLHENMEDFTDFDYPIGKINEAFDTLSRRYVEILAKVGEEYLKSSEEETIESNTFKAEKLYQMLVQYERDGADAELKHAICKWKEDVREWFVS